MGWLCVQPTVMFLGCGCLARDCLIDRVCQVLLSTHMVMFPCEWLPRQRLPDWQTKYVWVMLNPPGNVPMWDTCLDKDCAWLIDYTWLCSTHSNVPSEWLSRRRLSDWLTMYAWFVLNPYGWLSRWRLSNWQTKYAPNLTVEGFGLL